jgi:hypothetical protein
VDFCAVTVVVITLFVVDIIGYVVVSPDVVVVKVSAVVVVVLT